MLTPISLRFFQETMKNVLKLLFHELFHNYKSVELFYSLEQKLSYFNEILKTQLVKIVKALESAVPIIIALLYTNL